MTFHSCSKKNSLFFILCTQIKYEIIIIQNIPMSQRTFLMPPYEFYPQVGYQQREPFFHAPYQIDFGDTLQPPWKDY